jgi:hypothetical protein
MSSQQQPTNSNNDQSQNPPPQTPLIYQYNDYEDDPSIHSFNSLSLYPQSSYVTTGEYFDPTGQVYSNSQLYNDGGDDDIPSDIEAEINKAQVEMMRNEQLNDNEEDESVYSEAVQNAFANYENEQEEMFEQMRECMLYMSQEYSTAEMPSNLVERTQESKLNPGAAEFRPSWSETPTSTDKDAIVVTSWVPCEAKKQEEEQKDS